MITNIFDILITFIILICALYKIAEINNHFIIHKETLNDNKLMLQTISTMGDIYFTKGIPSQNIIYN